MLHRTAKGIQCPKMSCERCRCLFAGCSLETRFSNHASSSRSDTCGLMAARNTLAKAVCRRMLYARVVHEGNGDRRAPRKKKTIDILDFTKENRYLCNVVHIRARSRQTSHHPSIVPSPHPSALPSKDSKCRCLRTTSAPYKL